MRDYESINNYILQEVGQMDVRSPQHEVFLVIMRLLSVLMSRTKAGTKPYTKVSLRSDNIIHSIKIK